MMKWIPPAILVLLMLSMVSIEIWVVLDKDGEEHPLRQIYYNIEYNPVFDLVVTMGFGYLMYMLGRNR